METLRYEIDADRILTITFDAPDAAVNTMTAAWRRDFAAAAAQAVADKDRIRGVVLASAKPTFFAGAALGHVLTLEAKDAVPGFHEIRETTAIYRTLETFGRPVVSLVTGSALGGGWEVALIGHARFALDDPKIRFGMPEVTLGLIPGATGITKTVRHFGLMDARPFLLEGKLFGPREALELGWVDGVRRRATGCARRRSRGSTPIPTLSSRGTARTTACREAPRRRRRSPPASPSRRRCSRRRRAASTRRRRRSSRRWSKVRSSTSTAPSGSRRESSRA